MEILENSFAVFYETDTVKNVKKTKHALIVARDMFLGIGGEEVDTEYYQF